MNVAFRQDVAGARELAAAPLRQSLTDARIEIFDTLPAAEAAWRRLESTGAAMTPYQRFDWIMLWQRYIGGSEGLEPMVIVASDARGAPMFLLPLARHRVGPLRVATYFGGRHANLNAGLWRRDVAAAISGDDLQAILARAAASCGVDMFSLEFQPARVDGLDNPMRLLPHQRSPDDVYSATLQGSTGEEALRSVLKSSMRGRLRTKERKLQEFPGYRYVCATTAPDVDRLLSAFLKQKATHLAEQGISNIFDDPNVVAFLRAACHLGLSDGRPVIELHALECDTEVIAIFGGVNDGRRLSCMINSYAPGETSRWSPGLVLMTHLIQRCGETGVGSLDLGAGYASYKTFFCKETEQTFDTFLGVSMAGRLAAPVFAAALRGKGLVKSTPALWAATKFARRLINR